ncbi:hypothetical protein OCB39_25610 [Bacillus cereus]|nr:hypothetical protein [Bacillus cereus]
MRVLLINGHGDYAVNYFDEKYKVKDVVSKMDSEGIMKMRLADDYDEDGIGVEIHSFGDVDPKFIQFLYDENLIDSSLRDHQDFYVIEEEN